MARSPEDAAALVRFDERMALPLVLAALLPIVLMPGQTNSTVVDVIVTASWLVFLADFVEHERRLVHYLSSWWGRFDLSVVILTAPWFLFVSPEHTKFIMLTRLARLARIVLASPGARRLFQRLGRVALVAGIVLVTGCVIAYYAEHPTNPGFATFGDALWWGIVTLTTVGYGDIVPKTTVGRGAGVMIMITGIAVLGLLAGSLASFFRLEPRAGSSPPGEAPDDATTGTAAATDATRDSVVGTQLAALESQLARVADELARLRAAFPSPDA